MAKNRALSKNSRAARRATSPSINTDSSLKDVQPPPRARAERPNVLAVQRSAGVTKKTSRRKSKTQLSAKARRRHEKGLQMAEAVEDRTRSKVKKAEGRGKVVDARRREWKHINKEAEEDLDKGEVGAVGEEDGNEDGEKGWETDEMEDAAGGEDSPAGETNGTEAKTVDDDLDEIL